MKEWALRYLRQGLSVIPLKPKGKEPLIPWKEFQTRKATEAEVVAWFTKEPTANIGIVTGKISGVVVIDIDGQEGLAQASLMKLSSSVISFSGKGRHLWYQHPNLDVSNAVRKYPGIDIRGDGGYVLAAPSIHPNGARYRWLGQSVLSAKQLLVFPTTLFAPQNVPTPSGTRNTKPDSWIAKALEGMTKGNIDDTLFTICSRLRADGYSPDDARILLQPHAEKAGATPSHLDDKIENVWNRYKPNIKRNENVYAFGVSSSGNSGLTIHSPSNPESFKQFEASRNNKEFEGGESLETGYHRLDGMLKGGLKSSRLFTIAARTGVGKTNWLIGAAKHLCEMDKRVLLFSTEMPYTQIWERFISSLEQPENFKKYPFFVCDSFAPNLERVEEAVKEIKPDVFMFDHINHVSEEQRELGAFMQGLNFLRRKYDTAGIVTAQLNRQADWVDIKTGEKVTPRMSMIKGSGTIEQASSRVLLLSETRIGPEGSEIVGNLDKNDNGPKGLVHFMLKSNPYKMIGL